MYRLYAILLIMVLFTQCAKDSFIGDTATNTEEPQITIRNDISLNNLRYSTAVRNMFDVFITPLISDSILLKSLNNSVTDTTRLKEILNSSNIIKYSIVKKSFDSLNYYAKLINNQSLVNDLFLIEANIYLENSIKPQLISKFEMISDTTYVESLGLPCYDDFVSDYNNAIITGIGCCLTGGCANPWKALGCGVTVGALFWSAFNKFNTCLDTIYGNPYG